MKFTYLNIMLMTLVGTSTQDDQEMDLNHKRDFKDLEGFCEEGVLSAISSG